MVEQQTQNSTASPHKATKPPEPTFYESGLHSSARGQVSPTPSTRGNHLNTRARVATLSPATSRAPSSHPEPATTEHAARSRFATPIRHSTLEPSPKALKIVHNVRSLCGIIAHVKEGEAPVSDTKAAPSLGYQANFYLETHGYTDDAKALIGVSFHTAHDEEHFIQHMAEKGMPMLEALYIYTLIAERYESAE